MASFAWRTQDAAKQPISLRRSLLRRSCWCGNTSRPFPEQTQPSWTLSKPERQHQEPPPAREWYSSSTAQDTSLCLKALPFAPVFPICLALMPHFSWNNYWIWCFSAAPWPVTAGQAHSILDGEIYSFSLSSGKAPMQRVHPGLYVPPKGWSSADIFCLDHSPPPQSKGCSIAWTPGSAVSTPQTPPLPPTMPCPNTFLRKQLLPWPKEHFRSQNPPPSKASKWQDIRQHRSLQLLFHCHRGRQVTTSAPGTSVNPREKDDEKDYEEDRESFGGALTR